MKKIRTIREAKAEVAKYEKRYSQDRRFARIPIREYEIPERCSPCVIGEFMRFMLDAIDMMIDEYPLPSLRIFIFLVSQMDEKGKYSAPLRIVAEGAGVSINRLRSYLRRYRGSFWLEYEYSYVEIKGRRRKICDFRFPLYISVLEDVIKAKAGETV